MTTPLHVVSPVFYPSDWARYGWWCTPLMFRGANVPRVRCECGAELQWPDGVPPMNYAEMGATIAFPTEEDDK